MADQDIEAKAHALWDAAYSASAGEGEDAARAVIAQAIQEERDRCVDIVVKTIGQGLSPSVLPYVTAAWAERMRTQGGTKP